MGLRLPWPCLVVLVGPSGAGKSTWAATHFEPGEVVSTDALRALVGEGEHDQRAGTDAFDLLDLVVERRLRRGLLTVIDSLGLDDRRRRTWLEAARRHGTACHAVAFDTAAPVCRARNRVRRRPLPVRALASQLEAYARVRAGLAGEGFDGAHMVDPAGDPTAASSARPRRGDDDGDVDIVPGAHLYSPLAASRQRENPVPLRFGLQIPKFALEGGPSRLGPQLAAVAGAAEQAGFASLWVMDHFLQIPMVGREWEDMLDSYTTLGFLAGRTSRVRLGALVTGVTYRNVAHLAKIVATLDVLSGGRAVCGIGAAWFEREHLAYGWEFPPLRQRFTLLEDALRLLPVMWGPGSPSFEGDVLRVPEAICYPRPLQDRVPILVGGGGERRTLRLVARYADACNLFGDVGTVRHKLEVLGRHCQEVGRDAREIEVTHLSTALVAPDRAALDEAVERLRARGTSAREYAARVNAATVDDHVGRFRELAEAGVGTAIVNLPDLAGPGPVERFADVITAFE